MGTFFASLLVPVFLGIATQYVQANSEGQSTVLDLLNVCNKDYSSSCIRDFLKITIIRLSQGFPDLDLPTLDPLDLRGYDFDINLYLITMKIAFNKGDFKGFKQCQIFSFSVTKNGVDLSLLCNVVIDGDYSQYIEEIGIKVPGGDGHANINLRDLQINASVVLDTEEKNGETYLQIKDIKTKHDFLGVITYNITNLIVGEAALSEELLKNINQYWKVAAESLVNPILRKVINFVIESIKKILSKVPVNQLKTFYKTNHFYHLVYVTI